MGYFAHEYLSLCFHNPHFKSQIKYHWLWHARLIYSVKLNCPILCALIEFVPTFITTQITF